ncbi:hypothetical protein JJC00_18870 [Bradyrhizobium diazoefficiens]|uniref:hypothetical protein n=1 Tax=Bradyrhizobium diazoefficiens TaxID=1355477 RepID=UPI00190BDCEC|nr:hypothetical protein [Bradyrhizobium diazoefficiens]QQO30748.1 hypothetical protein JJC00_18870 [Bradyrhizobium diazoefficiens]
MSFSVSFFARDVHTARSKLREAFAPAAVKALVELAIAGIPPQTQPNGGAVSSGAANQSGASEVKQASTGNTPSPRQPRLCGILVEASGHIDEHGARSGLSGFRVEPYYD